MDNAKLVMASMLIERANKELEEAGGDSDSFLFNKTDYNDSLRMARKLLLESYAEQGGNSDSNYNCFQLVIVNLEHYRCNFKAKPFDLVFIPGLYGLCILVYWAGILMLLIVICALIALGNLCEVLNR